MNQSYHGVDLAKCFDLFLNAFSQAFWDSINPWSDYTNTRNGQFSVENLYNYGTVSGYIQWNLFQLDENGSIQSNYNLE